ncbi:MAG: hypothetical protein AB8G22_07915 [Saprospiraceae bacterium]
MASLKKRNKGAVPKMEDASDNMGQVEERIKRLNFALPESFVEEYKDYARMKRISLTELFKRSFDTYRNSQ